MKYLALFLAMAVFPALVHAGEINGNYLEARTCQIYTGPCFANSEINLTGKDALMAWNIREGSRNGVDLSGLSVIVVMTASDTLAEQGVNDPKQIKSAIIVDDKASSEQRDALIAFAKEHAGRGAEKVVRVDSVPIEMSLDTAKLTGRLKAGDSLKLVTRKCGEKDCICCNETAYYPPLAQVTHFAPGVATEGKFTGRGLGTTWSVPESRSAYMGTFNYE
ncbi:MAG TPA: DUF1326 domain-containing protein [Pirellulaceae bacterium]|nr:DUF1326 domain-containing protein [Pirellulaceae bacterium]